MGEVTISLDKYEVNILPRVRCPQCLSSRTKFCTTSVPLLLLRRWALLLRTLSYPEADHVGAPADPLTLHHWDPQVVLSTNYMGILASLEVVTDLHIGSTSETGHAQNLRLRHSVALVVKGGVMLVGWIR